MGKITEVVEKWAAEKWVEPPAIKWREDNNAATLKFTHTIDCGECNGYVEINENRDLSPLPTGYPAALLVNLGGK